MNYDDMPAGREMDALVAEKVMGWHRLSFSKCWISGASKKERRIELWSPSTDISGAWEVVEKMREKGFIWSINYRNPVMSDLKYMPYVGFWNYTNGKPYKQGHSDATEVPLAVCRAALKGEGEG